MSTAMKKSPNPQVGNLSEFLHDLAEDIAYGNSPGFLTNVYVLGNNAPGAPCPASALEAIKALIAAYGTITAKA